MKAIERNATGRRIYKSHGKSGEVSYSTQSKRKHRFDDLLEKRGFIAGGIGVIAAAILILVMVMDRKLTRRVF